MPSTTARGKKRLTKLPNGRLLSFGVVRIHRNHAVNVRHVLDVRRRGGDADREVKLEPPVNRVLPISRTHLKKLWAAFGET